MLTWKLDAEYDGTQATRASRWHNTKTIQGEFMAATRELFSSPAEVFSGEPTTAGVHALSQTVHLKGSELKAELKTAQLLKEFNEILPADININSIEVAADAFHARKELSAVFTSIRSRRGGRHLASHMSGG